ncbi:MAG TPA: hypothetical protein VIV11_42195 [Kofleriaceae bacterium]
MTDEQISLLAEIRDTLRDANREPSPELLAAKLVKAERALYMLEKNIGTVEDALIDIAETFDELAKTAGLPNRIARKTRGILERRRMATSASGARSRRPR